MSAFSKSEVDRERKPACFRRLHTGSPSLSPDMPLPPYAFGDELCAQQLPHLAVLEDELLRMTLLHSMLKLDERLSGCFETALDWRLQKRLS